MYCTNCGHQFGSDSKFCTKCGVPTQSAKSNEDSVNIPSIATDSVNNKQGIELSKVFLILGSIFIGLSVLGGVGIAGDAPEGSVASIFRLLVNWFLAISYLISLVGIVGGLILGIIFLRKSKENTPRKGYYKRNAIWAFVGPFVFMIAIIFVYIIIQIVYRFTSGSTN